MADEDKLSTIVLVKSTVVVKTLKNPEPTRDSHAESS